jgi:hypothetical protein
MVIVSNALLIARPAKCGSSARNAILGINGKRFRLLAHLVHNLVRSAMIYKSAQNAKTDITYKTMQTDHLVNNVRVIAKNVLLDQSA